MTRIRTNLRIVLAAVLCCGVVEAQGQARVDDNVVYGMYFGTALLMDVYYPEEPNGYGIVFIAGSGFHAPNSLDAPQLKEGPVVQLYAGSLVASGYTVFSINHRAAPRFRFPAAVDDAQRAVRFIRQNAARYGVNPERIGAMGGSSGGHLASMLGVLDGDGGTLDRSEIGNHSSKVQAVVALFPPTDAIAFATGSSGAKDFLGSFLGAVLVPGAGPESPELELYQQASPRMYVSSDDPPTLLMHGDADSVVPYEQSVLFAESLRDVGVPVELITVEGAEHGFVLEDGTVQFDSVSPAVSWFDRHLKQ